MTNPRSSSPFTETTLPQVPFGPPLIGALLRMPWEVVQRRMLERLHENGCTDLDAAHLNVFQYPGPQGARPSELAAQLRISKQALNYLLGQLERRGYLTRQADPDDQRSKRIVLTKRGHAVGHLMRQAVADVESEWAQELGPERFAQLRALLHDLNQETSRRGRGPDNRGRRS